MNTSSRRFAAFVTTTLATVTLGVVATTGTITPTRPTAAVTPRSDHRAAGAGELFSATPLALRSYPGTKAWRITFGSTSSTGRPITVSGAVIAPAKPSGTTPIIGYAPGTLGLGDQCAQSRNLDASSLTGAPSEKEYIQRYTVEGYAVAITDYQGLGTPGPYPYQVGRSEGHTVLDVLRAAQHLPGSGLTPAAKVAVAGYSQGGLAGGWAAQLARSYAPELKLAGVSVGGPPADVMANIAYIDGTKDAGLALAAVYGLDAAYPELHLERSLNAKGRAAFADLADDCVAELIGTKWQGHRLSEYTTENILARRDWRSRMARESLGRRTPHVPVLLYGSKDDETVPYTAVSRLRRVWRAGGADVTFYAPGTGNHGITGFAMGPVATGWTIGRILGLPTDRER